MKKSLFILFCFILSGAANAYWPMNTEKQKTETINLKKFNHQNSEKPADYKLENEISLNPPLADSKPISISIDEPGDLNWDAAFNIDKSQETRPLFQFMESYPIENLEIKFRLLDAKF